MPDFMVNISEYKMSANHLHNGPAVSLEGRFSVVCSSFLSSLPFRVGEFTTVFSSPSSERFSSMGMELWLISCPLALASSLFMVDISGGAGGVMTL